MTSLQIRSLRRPRVLLSAFSLTLIVAGCRTSESQPASSGGSGAASAGAPSAQAGAASAGGGAGADTVAGGTAGTGNGDAGNGGTYSAGGVASAGKSGASGANAGSGTAGGGAGSGGLAGSAGAQPGAGGSGSSLPPHSGSWRITPLGDSITGSTCGPQLLSKALIDHGKTNFTFVGSNLNNQSCNGASTVQTEGHGGYLVTDLVGSGQHAAELPKWCESNKSDLVLMQFGTNDVWNDRAPSAILDAFSTVLADLRAVNPNVVVLVAQITPLNPTGCSACETRVVALNSQIPAWASSKSTAASPVSVVDLHSAFTASSYTQNSSYTADGVHPNVAGAQLIANKWYDALLALGAP